MKQYCRYCTHCHYADSVYCDEKNKTMAESTAKAENHCKNFDFNEIYVFYCGDMDKRYNPREPIMKQCEGQTSLF